MSRSSKKKSASASVKRSRSTKTRPVSLEPSFAFLDAYAKALTSQDKSAATVKGYRNAIQQFTQWLMQTRGESYKTVQDLVRAITPTDIREHRAFLLNVKHAPPGTINQRLIAIRSLTTWARHQGWIEGDPVNGIKAVKQVTTAPRWLDRKEQYALRRAAEKEGNVRNLAILLLLMNTGLRVSEVAGLKLDDLKLSERKGEVVVRGKGSKVRTVPLNADARKALKEYLAKRPDADHQAVFVGQKGEPLGWLGIEYQIKTLARLAELENVTPHTLRHTFAKNLVDSGVSLDRVAMLLGYRSLTTTARYTQPSQDDLAREVEKLAVD
jgi:site-specific recombinase XerD